MKKKALLAGALCALLATSLLAGCGEPTTSLPTSSGESRSPSSALQESEPVSAGEDINATQTDPEELREYAFYDLKLSLPASWEKKVIQRNEVGVEPNITQFTAYQDDQTLTVNLTARPGSVTYQKTIDEFVEKAEETTQDFHKEYGAPETCQGIEGYHLQYTGKREKTGDTTYLYDVFLFNSKEPILIVTDSKYQLIALEYAAPVEKRALSKAIFEKTVLSHMELMGTTNFPVNFSDETEPHITTMEYLKVKPGMTYEQVVALFGMNGLKSGPATYPKGEAVTYTWYGTTGGKVVIRFVDSKVVSKEEYRLR